MSSRSRPAQDFDAPAAGRRRRARGVRIRHVRSAGGATILPGLQSTISRLGTYGRLCAIGALDPMIPYSLETVTSAWRAARLYFHAAPARLYQPWRRSGIRGRHECDRAGHRSSGRRRPPLLYLPRATRRRRTGRPRAKIRLSGRLRYLPPCPFRYRPRSRTCNRPLNAKIPNPLVAVDQQLEACIPAKYAIVCPVPKISCHWFKCRKDGCATKEIKTKVTPDISCRIVGRVDRGTILLTGAGNTLAMTMPVSIDVSAKDVGGIVKSVTATGSANVRCERKHRLRRALAGDGLLECRLFLER